MPIPASSVLPLLDQAKLRLNITSTTNDGELQDFLDTAAELVEQYVGSLDVQTYVETHYGVTPGRTIWLEHAPAVALLSVANSSGNQSGGYVLDTAAGCLRVPSAGFSLPWLGGAIYGDVTVTYTAGRTTLEAPVREAILVVMGRLQETQRGSSPSPLSQQPDGSPDLGGLPLLPPRARELLEPYRLGPRVA